MSSYQPIGLLFITIGYLRMAFFTRYNLNPTMRALQTQPTVSPTLIHHIQRGHIKVKPNISKIDGKMVYFSDDTSVEVDHIILCTGYHINVPYLSDELRVKVLDESSNMFKVIIGCAYCLSI